MFGEILKVLTFFCNPVSVKCTGPIDITGFVVVTAFLMPDKHETHKSSYTDRPINEEIRY